MFQTLSKQKVSEKNSQKNRYSRITSSAQNQTIQRKPICPCGGGCPRCSHTSIQTKLKISHPNDIYEQEADRIAEHIVNKSSSNQVNRKCASCQMKDEDEEMKIHRKAIDNNDFETSDEIANYISSIRGSGSPLDPSTRNFMESRFGFDFSKIRIHADDKAARAAESVNALAYTVGNDIVFGEGQHQPNTLEGSRLLAHELTHVVQQGHYTTPLPEDGSVSNIDVGMQSLFGLSEIAIQREAADQEKKPPTEHDLVEAGLLALGQVLQKVAGPESQALRDMYNTGELRIAAERTNLLAKGISESEVAKRLADMRYDLAMDVRKTGSALMRKGAELIDSFRGQARPTYESLRAAGKTDAQIIESATRTNEFVNRLPSGLKWGGRALWFVSIGLSIYVVISAPPEQRSAVAQKEIEGTLGGIGGAALGEAICIGFGLATEGLGLIVCGVLGGIAGSEGARRGHLLQILDIAPHNSPEMAGRIYRVEGPFKEIDLFILSIIQRTVDASENVLVVSTGMVSGEEVGGRGHYRSYQVIPANEAAVNLFGSKDPKYVPQYLLVPASADDLKKSTN